MKICPVCGFVSADTESFCKNCGNNIVNVVPVANTAVNGTAPQAPVYQPPVQGYPAEPFVFDKKKFTWYDISTLVGFVSSVVGLFWCSIFLLPLAAVTSFLGFKGNKTKGLAVAGIVISIIGILIKIGYILYKTGILPAWFTSGIFG